MNLTAELQVKLAIYNEVEALLWERGKEIKSLISPDCFELRSVELDTDTVRLEFEYRDGEYADSESFAIDEFFSENFEARLATRKAEEKAKADHARALALEAARDRQEEQERATLAKLKAKYEPEPQGYVVGGLGGAY